MSKIVPINGHVVMKLQKKYQSNDIIIPDSANENLKEGPIFVSDNPDYKPGEVYVYKSYGGFPFKHNGEDYLILDKDDFLIRLEE